MTKKFKLIKTFPNSEKLNTIYTLVGNVYYSNNFVYSETCMSQSEFFAPLVGISTDGKDIYLGDVVYPLYNNNTKVGFSFWVEKDTFTIPNRVLFSTEEAAQSWVEKQNKSKFEKGDWIYINGGMWYSLLKFDSYNIPDDDYFSVTEDYTIYTVGNVIEIRGYSNKWPVNTHHSINYSKATPEQIQDILSRVAIHKGFKEGVRFTGIHLSDYCVTTPFIYCKQSDRLVTNIGWSIYHKGKWAEIVEDAPKYVECVKSDYPEFFTEGKVYEWPNPTDDEGDVRKNMAKSAWCYEFKPSTKEAYNAQFSQFTVPETGIYKVTLTMPISDSKMTITNPEGNIDSVEVDKNEITVHYTTKRKI
jgi:hypothetical protein